jgi:regulator of cell morphogenesis and NO signaling
MEMIEIPKPKKAQTVGEIAASDVRKAEVFKKFGIEFCCGGNKTVEKACSDANICPDELDKALVKAVATIQKDPFQCNNYPPGLLIDHIYEHHHLFFYQEHAVISAMLQKTVPHHSKRHPELLQVEESYYALANELKSHFLEEEELVFPLIRKIYEARRYDEAIAAADIAQLETILQQMQGEHLEAGKMLANVSSLTNHYNPPAGACTTFKLLYHKLKRLEEDLHEHIHLENNILFTKALQLKCEVAKHYSIY